MRRFFIATAVIGAIAVGGCTPKIPESALQMTSATLEVRNLQTRSYALQDMNTTLSAGVGVMQDLGFKITQTEKELGLLVGEKMTDATHYGEIAGKILLAAFFKTEATWSKKRKLRASLFIRPNGPDRMDVRVTFQTMVWNNRGEITVARQAEEPELYQDFFNKLSKAAFLEEHKV